MVDTNFSVNAAGNLAQYNLVKSSNNEAEVINADDIKVIVKLGQFNKIRGLIRELENSSPDDREAAQKIAAFAEFYKKEINRDAELGIAVQFKAISGQAELWNALNEDLQKRILDLIERY
jgi:hypothetical protein